METHSYLNGSTARGTFSGTALTVLVNIHSADLLKTAILAAFGALVSFCVTVLLKWLWGKIRGRL